MGLSIRFTGGGADDVRTLATAGGWALVAEWANRLEPRADYQAVTALADAGHCNNTRLLSAQLVAALEASPPDDEDVRRTVEALIDKLGDGDDEESATVTGVGGED